MQWKGWTLSHLFFAHNLCDESDESDKSRFELVGQEQRDSDDSGMRRWPQSGDRIQRTLKEGKLLTHVLKFFLDGGGIIFCEILVGFFLRVLSSSLMGLVDKLETAEKLLVVTSETAMLEVWNGV
jgi:hypothetical protein